MAQKDYVGRGRSTGTRRKTNSRSKSSKKRGGGSGVSKFMIALAVAVLVTFAGGLWFIANHKKEETPVIPDHKVTGNGLPPKPEERWRYIKELENRQIMVPTPTEPSSGGELHSQTQLTAEQRQLLEQMQADMRQQPTQLNEVPWNEQTPAQRQQTLQRQQQQTQLQQQSRMPQQTQIQQQPRTQQPTQIQQQPRTQQQPQIQQQPHAQQQVRTQQTQQVPQPSRQQTQPLQQTQQPVKTQNEAPARAAPVTPVTREPLRQTETAAQPKAESKPKEVEKEKSPRWMVQCGSFKGTEQAESVRASLAFEGFESRITTGGGWNRVVIGPYSNRAAADSALKNLRGSGHSNCIPLAIGG